ncbi:hypothetical protein A2U01_0010946, partial [Trifolium medium]|nr:hypothetical protein [Trifolium medium]
DPPQRDTKLVNPHRQPRVCVNHKACSELGCFSITSGALTTVPSPPTPKSTNLTTTFSTPPSPSGLQERSNTTTTPSLSSVLCNNSQTPLMCTLLHHKFSTLLLTCHFAFQPVF